MTLQNEKDRINQNMLYYKSQMHEYMKKVDDLELNISTMKLEKTSLSTQTTP